MGRHRAHWRRPAGSCQSHHWLLSFLPSSTFHLLHHLRALTLALGPPVVKRGGRAEVRPVQKCYYHAAGCMHAS